MPAYFQTRLLALDQQHEYLAKRLALLSPDHLKDRSSGPRHDFDQCVGDLEQAIEQAKEDAGKVAKMTLDQPWRAMAAANSRILTINGGSSSIKFALFEAGDSLRRILEGGIERIGQPEATLRMKGLNETDHFSRSVAALDHPAAVDVLMDAIEDRSEPGSLAAVGHRVVHGGPNYSEPQRITAEMVEELRRLCPFDPEHLPEEILLTEALHRRFPALPQIACFDTAFHHDLPRVAQLLPIPRSYMRRRG